MRYVAIFALALLFAQPLLAKEASQADLKKIQSEIRKTEQRIIKQQSEQSQVQRDLQKSEKSLGKSKAAIHSIQKSIATEQKQIAQLQAEKTQLESDKMQQEKIIGEQINASYRLGREKKIKVLLNQEEPQKLSRALIYTDYFNKARIESITEYQKTVTQIAQLTPELEAKSARLLHHKEKLLAEQKTIEREISSRNKALGLIKTAINHDKGQVRKLQKDQKELESLLKAVEITVQNIKLPSDSTPFKKMYGKLLWPTAGRLDKRYGRKRQNSDLSWEGVAFYANEGTPIKAAHHGRVVFADWFRGKGLLLIIDHGSGYMSLYAHSQSLLREAGDWVSAGETIATVGNSGGLDHTELYFEIRKNGKPLNPQKWLHH